PRGRGRRGPRRDGGRAHAGRERRQRAPPDRRLPAGGPHGRDAQPVSSRRLLPALRGALPARCAVAAVRLPRLHGHARRNRRAARGPGVSVAAGIIVGIVVLATAVLVIGLFLWAAVKDG